MTPLVVILTVVGVLAVLALVVAARGTPAALIA